MLLALVGAPTAYYFLHEEVVTVTVTTVERGHVEDTITSIAAGTVMAKQDSLIAAGMIGTIVSVPEEGRRFEEDDVLVALDQREFDAQVRLAEGNLKVGESRLKQARLAATIYEEITATRVSLTRAQLELARAEFDRIKSLSERKAVSASDLDKAQAALRTAEETYLSLIHI